MELQQAVPYSQLRNSARASLAAKLPLPLPFALHIETTNRCNFKCRMCPVSFDDWETVVGGITKIPFAAIETLYADLAGMSPGSRLKVIRFYGEGEPMLDKDLTRSIRLAHEMDITERTEVTSNGSALTENVGRNLIDSGLTYLRISIYGVTEERQKYITQTNISAERVYQNVCQFRNLRDRLGSATPFLYVKMIDTGAVEEQQLLRERYEAVADEIMIEPAMDWDSYDNRNLLQLASPGSKTTPRRARRLAHTPFIPWSSRPTATWWPAAWIGTSTRPWATSIGNVFRKFGTASACATFAGCTWKDAGMRTPHAPTAGSWRRFQTTSIGFLQRISIGSLGN